MACDGYKVKQMHQNAEKSWRKHTTMNVYFTARQHPNIKSNVHRNVLDKSVFRPKSNPEFVSGLQLFRLSKKWERISAQMCKAVTDLLTVTVAKGASIKYCLDRHEYLCNQEFC